MRARLITPAIARGCPGATRAPTPRGLVLSFFRAFFATARAVTNNARSKKSWRRSATSGQRPDLPRGETPSKDGPPADPYLCSFNWEPEPNRRSAAGESQRFVSLADHYSSVLARGILASRHCVTRTKESNPFLSRPTGLPPPIGGCEGFLRYLSARRRPRLVSILLL